MTATIVVELLAVLTALVVFFTAVVTSHTKTKVEKTSKEVSQIHILVNSKMTAALERIEQLAAALEKADEPVPSPEPPYDL